MKSFIPVPDENGNIVNKMSVGDSLIGPKGIIKLSIPHEIVVINGSFISQLQKIVNYVFKRYRILFCSSFLFNSFITNCKYIKEFENKYSVTLGFILRENRPLFDVIVIKGKVL